MKIDISCYERGCPCYDPKEGDGVTVMRREWVGLTDDDFKKFKSDEFVVFASDIEKILKERNT